MLDGLKEKMVASEEDLVEKERAVDRTVKNLDRIVRDHWDKILEEL